MNARRMLRRGLLPFTVVVVSHAAVQTLLVAIDPREPFTTWSLLLSALSGAALLAAVCALWRIAERSALLDRRLGPLVVRTAVVGVATALAAVLLPPLVPVLVAAGCAVLAAGGVVAAGAMAARHPLRFTLLALATLVAVLFGWVADLLLGLFVTGAPAAAASWLVVGAAAVPLICLWLATALRPARIRSGARTP